MGQSILDKYENAAQRAGVYAKETNKAIKWYKDVVHETAYNRKRILSDEKTKNRSNLLPGRMMTFQYDPKTKKSLPYYDRFPMVIVIDKALKPAGSFYGLNLHYLPPKLRAKLLFQLNDFVTNNKYDSSTRYALSYKLLSKAARLKWFKPCFKHYLPKHIKSNIVQIESEDWVTACFLPTEHFAKSTREQVWAESKRMVV